MPWSIDERFRTPHNAGVVAFVLARPSLSAHDEVAEVLTRSAEGLEDVRSYCPDPAGFAYFALHTAGNRIFGLAYGQRSLAYRLFGSDREAALAAGGQPQAELGPDWVVFELWRGPSVDDRRWCKAAHDAALR